MTVKYAVVAISAAILLLVGTDTVALHFATQPQQSAVHTSTGGNGSHNGLAVSGNQLVNGSGQRVFLKGVNRAGTEYACSQGWGIFDGPSDEASVRSMTAWGINFVRIPLNEDCWLGINGVKSKYSGARYVNAIVNYVNLLRRHGMYAELSLMWGAPSTNLAHYQSGGPDADHSPDMWSSMAATFRGYPNVILAPWGETITGWRCFMLTGCHDQATYGTNNRPYRTASMQQAVTLMRAAGYTGVISIPCIAYANQCADYNGSSWWKTHPTDPLHNLVAEAHVYGNNLCGSQHNGACLQAQYGKLATHVPVIWGEVGETYDASSCGSSAMRVLIPWADTHISGYAAWAWDTNYGCLSLINKYTGTPANGYAQYLRAQLVRTFQRPLR